MNTIGVSVYPHTNNIALDNDNALIKMFVLN